MNTVTINPEIHPFSYAGAYTAFMLDEGKLYLNSISGKYIWANNHAYLIEPVDQSGSAITHAKYNASSTSFTIKVPSGKIEICYQDTYTIRIRAEGVGVKFTAANKCNPPQGTGRAGQWRWKMANNCIDYAFSSLYGDFVASESCISFLPVDAHCEIAIQDYLGGIKFANYSKQDFEQCKVKAENKFADFLASIPELPGEFSDAAKLASYICWSCIVHPRGLIKRPLIYSSKHIFHSSWSWDQCFFAICCAPNLPDLAWDNFYSPFDYQDERGMIPDACNDYYVAAGTFKPPVHGWTFMRMLELNPELGTQERLKEAYRVLAKWTDFWFEYQDDDNDGIPQYNCGCDSGWDNATVFKKNLTVMAPDLCSYLVLQMDALSELAGKLGKEKEMLYWSKRSAELLDKMIACLWTGKRFEFKAVADRSFDSESRSLINFIPLVLGKKLPEEIRQQLIFNLINSGFITPYGLASEHPESQYFIEDGYWSGAVWSPPHILITWGLRECGEEALAAEIVERYCRNCAKNGFPENFSALTGAPQRDQAMPWMAAVFLAVGNQYLNPQLGASIIQC